MVFKITWQVKETESMIKPKVGTKQQKRNEEATKFSNRQHGRAGINKSMYIDYHINVRY